MKISIDRTQLLTALSVVKTAAMRKGTLPILANVMIVANDKSVTLTGTDLDTYLRVRIDANVQMKGETTCRAHLLADIAANANSPGIDLELKGQVLHVACAATRFQLATLATDEFPPYPRVSDVSELSLPQATLLKAIASTAFAMSDDESRYVLNGLHLESKAKALVAAATDGRRVTEITMPVAEAKPGIAAIVPRKAVTELLRLLDPKGDDADVVTISVNKTKALFTFSNISLVTKLIDGAYPNYRQVIPEVKISTVLNRSDLVSAVQRMDLVSDSCILDLKKQSLGITSGKSKDSLDTASDSLLVPCQQEVRTQLATRYVIETLNAVAVEDLKFTVSEGGLVAFQSPEGNWISVIAAMRE